MENISLQLSHHDYSSKDCEILSDFVEVMNADDFLEYCSFCYFIKSDQQQEIIGILVLRIPCDPEINILVVDYLLDHDHQDPYYIQEALNRIKEKVYTDCEVEECEKSLKNTPLLKFVKVNPLKEINSYNPERAALSNGIIIDKFKLGEEDIRYAVYLDDLIHNHACPEADKKLQRVHPLYPNVSNF